MAAQSVKQADCVFGVTYRRLKAEALGPALATVATAHAIARVVYRMLKYMIEYETISVEEYEKKYRDQIQIHEETGSQTGDTIRVRAN